MRCIMHVDMFKNCVCVNESQIIITAELWHIIAPNHRYYRHGYVSIISMT